jgi:hypothetical protein
MKKNLLLLLLSLFGLFTQAQTNISGIINTNTTWSLANSPYIVTGNVIVNSGAVLIIEPGVIVKFDDNKGIVINGLLSASGTSNNRITFTSNKLNPQSGDWGNIKLTSVAVGSTWDINGNFVSGSVFKYCVFSFAGNSAIYSDNSLYVSNCNFIDNRNWGEYRHGVYQQGSQYYYAGGAITTLNGNSLIQKNLFFNNTSNNGYGHGFGGAIYSSSSKIINNLFISNNAEGNGEGGAIYSIGVNQISNCNFINNTAQYSGSSINSAGSNSILNSTFHSNSIDGHGAISNQSSGSLSVNNSNFMGDENFIIYNRNSNNIDAKNNYWSPNIFKSIDVKLFDFNDQLSLGSIDYSLNLSQINTLAPISPPINVVKRQVGSDVVLTWTANLETDIAGYKICYGSPTGYSYTSNINATNVRTYTIIGGNINTEYAVTAYDNSADGIDDQVDGNESWFSIAKEVKVTLSSSATSISEPADSATLTATLDNTSSNDVIINLTYSGIAKNGTDYSGASSITVLAGSLTGTSAIIVIDDSDVELTEIINIDVNTVTSGSEVGSQQIIINLTDDDKPTVSIALSKTIIAEHESAIVTATIDRPTSKDVIISLESTGTAVYNQDFKANSALVIPAGQTSAQLIVSGIEDNLDNEGIEQIVLKMTVQNALFNTIADIKIDIKDNTKTLTLNSDSPFTGLENGAVTWGDYDRDGDQDVAVMGTGNSGAVTKLYENRNGVFIDTNQNFTKLFGGDISWIDLNKDGWIDLVVSGFNTTPQTKVYMNNKGTSFSPSTEYGLPQLYSSKMDWGDLDNDGDIDLAISGIDINENYVFNILYREDKQNKFIIEPKSIGMAFGPSGEAFIKGGLKIVDVDADGDNDIVSNGEGKSGFPIGGISYNSYIKTQSNNNNFNLTLKNSVIAVAKMNNSQSNLTVFSSGVDYSGVNQCYSSSIIPGSGFSVASNQFPKLKNGDIAVADFNNDGTNDILFTGEDSVGIPTTKLWIQDTNGNYMESPIVLQGLRNSTANWVDYDMDGDLDLFLTGTSATGGAKSLLYVSDIANKKNAAPPTVSGLIAEDLGNGKIKFKWNTPKDDYSTNLGYVIKLGTTPGGTELSNTESNLTTGARLITKPAPIYTEFYEMQLNPGKYYWSVQAVDTGLKGGGFSVEDSFTLTYDWKIINQGGIIDRSISGIEAPIIKLADLDNDNDLDLIYANSIGAGSNIMRFDGKRLIADGTSSAASIISLNNVSSVEVGDITGDGVVDFVMNTFNSNNYFSYLPNGSRNGEISLGGGLYKAKARIIDINNDGQAEIVLLGMSTNTLSGLPKLWIYEYDKSTNPPTFKKTDASAQIAPLANASFDLGDIDKDQDIDLIISGFSASDGLKCIIYENITELAGSFTLKATDNNLVAIKDGTTDFIDFDGDGDLDAVFTGTSINSDIFEIYINKLNEGISTWPRFSSGLIPMRQSKIDLGDFNGDGYCDLLYSGITGGGAGNVTKLSEYSPAIGAYIDSAFDVSDIMNAEVEFGDIDGDQDLDFVIVGKNKNYNINDPYNSNNDKFIFRTYLNVRNDSALVLASTTGKQSNTNKTFSSKTATYNINETPSVPGLPSVPVKLLNNVSSKVGTYPVELSWLAASDDHTRSDGLTYAIKIGTTPGSENIMGANSNVSGIRKVSGKGNAEHNKKWRLSLPVGIYYWSVQAIDASYSGSEFSVANKFEITSKGLSTKSFDKEILVKAYPNPTSDIVTVTIPNEFVLEKIEMYNSLGQFVAQYNKNLISVQNLANGNYFLKIYTSGGTTTKKIIKL